MIQTMLERVLQVIDSLSLHLHLVCEFEVKIVAWLAAPSLIIQHEILLCEGLVHFAELDRTHQYPRKDLYANVKRFHKKSLDCCDPITKDVLVEVCLQEMIEHY